MQIVTWNVNSLKARADFVGRYLDEVRPEVIGMQEIKGDDPEVPAAVLESRGYHLVTQVEKARNGVILASKEPIADAHVGLPGGDDGQARLVAGTTFGIRFVNLYCPQGQEAGSPAFAYKLGFYDALIEWLEASADRTGPLCVLGDLNIAPGPDDVWSVAELEGVPSYHPLEHERWARLLGLGLTDAARPHLAPRTFSFWDYRGGAFHRKQGMRIDHLLTTEPVAARVESATVDRDWRKKKDGLTPSDHAPVRLTLRD